MEYSMRRVLELVVVRIIRKQSPMTLFLRAALKGKRRNIKGSIEDPESAIKLDDRAPYLAALYEKANYGEEKADEALRRYLDSKDDVVAAQRLSLGN
jgi:hypothetical protein